MEDVPTQLRKGALELAVLALLAQQPRYAVEIVDDLAQRPGLEASAGTIYPLLTRLKNSGLVNTRWHESPVGPPRKYYTLSTSGVRHFEVQRDAWLRLSTALITLLKEVQS